MESLITTTPSFRGRNALFEDSPKADVNDVTGSLHQASDEHIRRAVKRTGAVALVKQIAGDLADSETEMAKLRRRAEDREIELKKMLKEVGVSDVAIEKRLRHLQNSEDSAGLGIAVLASDLKKRSSRGGRDRIASVNNAIDQMMGEAMKEDVGILEVDEDYLNSLDEKDKQATVKAGSLVSKEPGRRSTASSVDSQGRASSTLRGWKGYFWSGNATSKGTSEASSVMNDHQDDQDAATRKGGQSSSNGRRKGLDEDLFSPLARASTTQDTVADTRSRKSSTSVSSWTTKLFAGNNQASRESENQGTARGRSVTNDDQRRKSSRGVSKASETIPPVPPVPTSARAALMRVSTMEVNAVRPSKKPVQPLKLGPSHATKPANPGSVSQVATSPASTANAATNLGPVEMDTIHPPETRPPTLIHTNGKPSSSSDLLTDRFGFIYDHQRRKKEEAQSSSSHRRAKSNASANVEMISGLRDALKPTEIDQTSQKSKLERPETPASTEDRNGEKPSKRWTDYLKVATFPTELLSHTPSAKSGTNVISADSPSPQLKRSPTGEESRASLPSISLSNPEPEILPVTASNAEMSTSKLNGSADKAANANVDGEPVKLLLAQLTDLHDTLQREKTVKWNEFLRKVRAARKKESELAPSADVRSKQTDMPEVKLTDGEMIGVAGLGNKGKVGRAKWKEFKQLVLGGIPVIYRAKIWAECSGASALKVPGYYDDLVNNGDDDPVIVSQIQMDINRTLTDNVFFRNGPGVTKLNEVLLAYSRRNPDVGYCQGMNLITASLLLILPTAEDAFWVLTSMIENTLPQHYYDKSLLASRADQQVLREYVTEILPKLSAHLDEMGIELEALTFQWFLSVFTDCLSAEALFRVWDVIFCFNDGSTFLFQVAVALLKLNESQLLECDSAARVYGYIGNEMTDHAISIDGLINASDALKNDIRRSEVEERRWRAVEEAKGREKGRVRGSVSEGVSTSSSTGELSMQEPRPLDDMTGAGVR